MRAVSSLSGGAVIAIDGKVLRRSSNREDRVSTLHMVSASASANGVVLGQVKTDAKSNEITAISALLALLDIGGCLVSIDAIGYQTAIAAHIVEKDSNYLLAVKGNQESLCNAVRRALSSVAPGMSDIACVEQNRGRVEMREYHVIPATQVSRRFPTFKGLTTLGVAIGYRYDP